MPRTRETVFSWEYKVRSAGASNHNLNSVLTVSAPFPDARSATLRSSICLILIYDVLYVYLMELSRRLHSRDYNMPHEFLQVFMVQFEVLIYIMDTNPAGHQVRVTTPAILWQTI
jgi:hypothetical protein